MAALQLLQIQSVNGLDNLLYDLGDKVNREALEEIGIDIEIGSTVTIEYPENPTTGFNWVPLPESLEGGIFSVETEYIKHDSPDCQNCTGVGGKKWIHITGLSLGTAKISVEHKRSWENNSVDSSTIAITVINSEM